MPHTRQFFFDHLTQMKGVIYRILLFLDVNQVFGFLLVSSFHRFLGLGFFLFFKLYPASHYIVFIYAFLTLKKLHVTNGDFTPPKKKKRKGRKITKNSEKEKGREQRRDFIRLECLKNRMFKKSSIFFLPLLPFPFSNVSKFMAKSRNF